MAKGKWIQDLTPDMPVETAARLVFEVRLELVREDLPRVLHDEDPEDIHQLRVATRRARAALRIFAACLPDKVCQAARKILGKIRRAAGAARDCDVFLEQLRQRVVKAPAQHKPGLDFLAGYVFAERHKAQADVVDFVHKKTTVYGKIVRQTLASIQAPRKKKLSLRNLAQPLLAELLHNVQQAAAQDLDNIDNMHQVRIQGKRLRYAMEIFESCFSPAFREQHYPAVTAMQDMLGQANDSYVAGQRLADLAEALVCRPERERLQPGLDALQRFHRERLARQRQQFTRWWQDWQISRPEQSWVA